MTQAEFEALIEDNTKRIDGDINWTVDEDHSPTVEFRAEISSDPGYPIFVRGSFNPLIDALSYTIVHRGCGRIYALDMGKDHHNPTCQNVGDKHKHRWTEIYRDKLAYVPGDITAPSNDPNSVWLQFCIEARIVHAGTMQPPPPTQDEFL